MGIVFQNNCLIENWSVRDNVLIAIQQQEMDNGTESMEERLDKILEYVDLNGYKDRKVSELSGGQAQRVAIARALIKKPKVIFADEPTGNLDEKSSRCVFDLLKKISEECLVVVVSHDERAAYEYGDRIIKLADGEVIDDVVINSTDIEYSLSIKDCNEGIEAFETARNVERIRDFLLKKIISGENKQFYIDYKVKKINKKFDTREKKHRKIGIKNIPIKTIWSLCINNIQNRKMRIFIMTMIMSIALVFLQLLSNIYVAKDSVPISEYLSDNIDEIVLKTRISYFDDLEMECMVETGNSDKIKNILQTEWKQNNIIGLISGVDIEYGERNISAVMSIADKGSILVKGEVPDKNNEICITDFIAYLLELDEKCIGTCIEVFGNELYISGIIDTDCEENGVIDRIEKKQTTEYDEYNIEYFYRRIYGSAELLDYLQHSSEYISIKASNFTISNSEIYLLSNTMYSSTEYVEKDKIIYGRYPQKENEAVVSYDFAVYNGLLVDDTFDEQIKYTFKDIDDEKYNSAYSGYINMADFYDEIKIVGVVDANCGAEVFVAREKYEEIKDVYFSSAIFDAYSINIENVSEEVLEESIYNTYKNGIYIDEPNVLKINSVYYEKERLLMVMLLLITVFALLLIMLDINFVSYNINDNQRKIGIFMALGIKRRSIALMFLCESLLIMLTSFVLSTAVSFVCLMNVNAMLSEYMETELNFFYFNNITICCIFLFTVVLAGLSVLVPIKSITKEKPMKLIKELA